MVLRGASMLESMYRKRDMGHPAPKFIENKLKRLLQYPRGKCTLPNISNSPSGLPVTISHHRIFPCVSVFSALSSAFL
jgi:hypothetical protein